MPKSDTSIGQWLFSAAVVRFAASVIVVFGIGKGMEMKTMVATIPAEMFVEVMIVLAIVTVITGLLVMIVRWDMHLAAEDKARGPISFKHVAAGVLGMILALGVALLFVPLAITKFVAEPDVLDYQLYGGVIAFIVAILVVALTQFGFSKVKDFIERAGEGICDLILSGKATAADIQAALADATPKEKKKIAAAITEKKAADEQEKILAEAIAPKVDEVPKAEEIA